jgi:hypothetical protein
MLRQAAGKERNSRSEHLCNNAMRHWAEKLDTFLTFNEKDLLTHAGKISAQIAEKLALERYEEFNQNRREEEQLRSDAEDKILFEAIRAIPGVIQKSDNDMDKIASPS